MEFSTSVLSGVFGGIVFISASHLFLLQSFKQTLDLSIKTFCFEYTGLLLKKPFAERKLIL